MVRDFKISHSLTDLEILNLSDNKQVKINITDWRVICHILKILKQFSILARTNLMGSIIEWNGINTYLETLH